MSKLSKHILYLLVTLFITIISAQAFASAPSDRNKDKDIHAEFETVVLKNNADHEYPIHVRYADWESKGTLIKGKQITLNLKDKGKVLDEISLNGDGKQDDIKFHKDYVEINTQKKTGLKSKTILINLLYFTTKSGFGYTDTGCQFWIHQSNVDTYGNYNTKNWLCGSVPEHLYKTLCLDRSMTQAVYLRCMLSVLSVNIIAFSLRSMSVITNVS